MNKARIFALYWGAEHTHKVLVDGEWQDRGVFAVDETTLSVADDEDYNMQLILTPLSEITDEDAIEVAKICGINDIHEPEDEDDEPTVSRSEFGRIEVRYWELHRSIEGDEWDWHHFAIDPTTASFWDYMGVTGNAVQAIDFLRSKSYALPFEGQDLFESGIAIKPQP